MKIVGLMVMDRGGKDYRILQSSSFLLNRSNGKVGRVDRTLVGTKNLRFSSEINDRYFQHHSSNSHSLYSLKPRR